MVIVRLSTAPWENTLPHPALQKISYFFCHCFTVRFGGPSDRRPGLLDRFYQKILPQVFLQKTKEKYHGRKNLQTRAMKIEDRVCLPQCNVTVGI